MSVADFLHNVQQVLLKGITKTSVLLKDTLQVDLRVVGDDVLINRNCAIQSKGGDIEIGRRVSLGANSQFVSWAGLKR